MKKAISMLLALALTVTALAGCSAKQQQEEPVIIDDNANVVNPYSIENSAIQLNIDASNEIKDISELLYGIFFEDINFSCDGGLYAEMVANRSFEFNEMALDDELYSWSSVKDADISVNKNATDSLNENNPNYLVIKNGKNDLAGAQNHGFLEGMAVKAEGYSFSLYAKALDNYSGGITVRLVSNGNTLAEGNIPNITADWQKYELTLNPSTAASEEVYLQVLINSGSVAVDMVSLFPEATFNNRPNGLRNDLATMLADLTPRFLRFPGGCVIEGADENSAYDWKASVGADINGEPLMFNGKLGDVAARRQGIDVWTDMNATDDPYPSFMTYGLGFYEYFQLAEDIGAIGVPVINAGLYCQGRGGILVDMDTPEFQRYIDDMLDLVEFCRGDENTKWGKVRCDIGHTEPFELKYICVGNENWGEDYYIRYNKFVEALNEAREQDPELYADIELIYSAGPDDVAGADYIKSYEYASDKLDNNFAGAIDQHYYNDVGWFMKNADYYDEANYSRDRDGMTSANGGAINVFLGEYASWSNRMNSALAESVYMTGLERNGDIVRMATYAPLFSSATAWHWAPNLIWYNNQDSMGSLNYYAQKLFANNQGAKLLDSQMDGAFVGDKAPVGRIGVGTWNTTAKFDNIKIVDNATGNVLGEDDFSSKSIDSWDVPYEGKFKIKKGALTQTSKDTQTTEFGSVAYFGDESWSNYTYTLEATKLDGEEGFFLPIFANSTSQYYWNIGGYGNTLSCLQQFNYGYKTGQLDGTVKDFVVETGKTYQLKVVSNGTHIECYIDDVKYVDYDTRSSCESSVYQVVSTDETGDIIVKLVNVTNECKELAINIDNANVGTSAKVYQLQANDILAENIFGDANQIGITELDLTGIGNQFNYRLPRYSITIIRIPRG